MSPRTQTAGGASTRRPSSPRQRSPGRSSMHSPQLADAALYAALAADTTLARLAAPEDHRHTQIAGALAALERLDEPQALCAFVQTSAALAAPPHDPQHART